MTIQYYMLGERKSKLLIITSLGRAGTSLVAKFCKGLGYDPGGEWSDITDAGMEDYEFVQVHDRIRLATNFPARYSIPTIEQIKAMIVSIDSQHKVIKDPRLVDTRMFEYWKMFCPSGVKVLLLHRDFIDSRVSRANKGIVFEPYGGYHFVFAQFVQYLLRWDIEFRMLYFPNYLSRPEVLIKDLQDLGLEINTEQALGIWAKIYDPSKVHVSLVEGKQF